MSARYQIVIAWTEQDVEIVRHRRIDLGEQPITRSVTVPKTALWMNAGTESDVAKARAYADANGYTVYTFPQSEPDARGAAARAILAA